MITSDTIINWEMLFTMCAKHGVENITLGGRTRATGEKEYIRIDFKNKNYEVIMIPITLESTDKKLEKHLLLDQISRSKLKEVTQILIKKDYQTHIIS